MLGEKYIHLIKIKAPPMITSLSSTELIAPIFLKGVFSKGIKLIRDRLNLTPTHYLGELPWINMK